MALRRPWEIPFTESSRCSGTTINANKSQTFSITLTMGFLAPVDHLGVHVDKQGVVLLLAAAQDVLRGGQ